VRSLVFLFPLDFLRSETYIFTHTHTYIFLASPFLKLIQYSHWEVWQVTGFAMLPTFCNNTATVILGEN